MDPNANLKAILKLAAKIVADADNGGPDENDAARLAELVQALDEWICGGGFLPKRWLGRVEIRAPSRPEKPTKPEKQVKGTRLTPYEWALLREGQLISCIQHLRDRLPLSLYDAKKRVDTEQEKHPELLEKSGGK